MPCRWREGPSDPADSWSFRDRIDQWQLTGLRRLLRWQPPARRERGRPAPKPWGVDWAQARCMPCHNNRTATCRYPTSGALILKCVTSGHRRHAPLNAREQRGSKAPVPSSSVAPFQSERIVTGLHRDYLQCRL